MYMGMLQKIRTKVFLYKQRLASHKTLIISFFVAALVIFVSVVWLFSLKREGIGNQDTELSDVEMQWNRVFEKAFEPVDCPEPRDPSALPDGYYKGLMIDAHVHMQSLPEDLEVPPELSEGEDIGVKNSVDKWACMMDAEWTYKAFTFFPVWEPIIPKHIELAKQIQERYPGRFVPFINPPFNDGSSEGYPTVDAGDLEDMLAIEPDLFVGYGEIGLYGRPDNGAGALPPDSQRLLEIYPVVREQNLVVYFHLGEGQKESFKRAAGANPDITFIFHGDQLVEYRDGGQDLSQIEDILTKHPNVYYGVDELYGDVWLLKPGREKEDFIAHFSDYGPLLEADLATFKDFIESHPDQVLWGTDRGVSTPWDKDVDIALVLNDYTRAFIGKLPPDVQEKFAYKNAERLLQNR